MSLLQINQPLSPARLVSRTTTAGRTRQASCRASGPSGASWTSQPWRRKALRRALAPFIDAARRGPGAGRQQGRGGQRAGASGLDTTEVREWARTQGIEVKDRGRIPAEVVARFKAATGR